MRTKNSIFLLLVLLAHSECDAQVYKLSENNPYNIRPGLIKDKSGRIYCFWLTDSSSSICPLCVDTSINNFTLCYRTFDSGTWSAVKTVEGSASQWYYGYDVDADTTGNIWIARIVGPTVLLFRNHAGNSFVRKSTLIDSTIFLDDLRIITVSAIDSNTIWFDYHRDRFKYYARWISLFNGNSFLRKTFAAPSLLTETTVDPLRAFKTSFGVAYFLRIGSQLSSPSGQPGYPYTELLSSLPSDSVVIYATRDYSASSLAGPGSGGLIYFFYVLEVKGTSIPTLDIIDEHSKKVITKLSNLTFFPSTLSKQGPILIAAKKENDRILLKGIRDSTFLRTTIITDSTQFADTARRSLSVLSDTGSVAWVAWQATLAGQSHIFVARTELSMNIDTNVVLDVSSLPHTSGDITFELQQNYPNPFNPSTTVQYSLPTRVHVRLVIYDLLGRQLASLVDEVQQAGIHNAKFDATRVSTGIYFYRITAGQYSKTRKIIVLK